MSARDLLVVLAALGALLASSGFGRADAATALEPVPWSEQEATFGGWGGGGDEGEPEPEPDDDEFTMTPAIDTASFVGGCASSRFSYRIEATASTSTSRSVDYIAAKVTLKVGGVVRGDTDHRERSGPISSISDSVSYDAPCSKPFLGVSASSWHKAKKGSNVETDSL